MTDLWYTRVTKIRAYFAAPDTALWKKKITDIHKKPSAYIVHGGKLVEMPGNEPGSEGVHHRYLQA